MAGRTGRRAIGKDSLSNATRRQIALMVLFGERRSLTAAQAAELVPDYATQGLKRPIDSAAKDLAELRAMGFPIVHAGEVWTYDESQFIPVDMDRIDPNLLRAVIYARFGRGADQQGSPAGNRGLLNAISALTKLNSNVSTIYSDRDAQTRACLPDDSTLFAVVEAIEARRQISFDYESAQSGTVTRRVLAPMTLFANQGNQYVSGMSWRQEDAGGSGQWRNFRISRMSRLERCAESADGHRMSEAEKAEATARAQKRASGFFTAAEAWLALRPGACEPIRALGAAIAPQDRSPWPDEATRLVPEGWDRVQLHDVDRMFLFHRLATYGSDMRLVGPASLVADYRRRLAHLGALA